MGYSTRTLTGQFNLDDESERHLHLCLALSGLIRTDTSAPIRLNQPPMSVFSRSIGSDSSPRSIPRRVGSTGRILGSSPPRTYRFPIGLLVKCLHLNEYSRTTEIPRARLKLARSRSEGSISTPKLAEACLVSSCRPFARSAHHVFDLVPCWL